jgi:predicted porin
MMGAAAAAVVSVLATDVSAAEDPALADIVHRLDQLEKSNNELKKENEQLKGQLNDLVVKTIGPTSADAIGPDPQALLPKRAVQGFLERKPGTATFYTPRGEVTAYGNMDLSVDVVTKGLGGKLGPDGKPPLGNMGWQPDLSTNLSYVGFRGFETITNNLKFVYQFETQIDIADTDGVGETDNSNSNVVKGGLTSRNTWLGFASSDWGAIKFGKTDTPYKTSTAKMNAFSGMLGDYQVIMANTGGDNRVEFGTRLDHSIWYESPNWNGLSYVLLFSPGQNRADDSSAIASGESDCTGGNAPGSGGITPETCTDGSFSDAVSTSLTYVKGPLTLVAAYERHEKVNRSSDITGIYGSDNAYSQMLEAQDVADEDAGKVAVAYQLPTHTTIDLILEHMDRYVPKDLQFQDERTRSGTWFAVSQQLTPKMSAHFGWAHAFRTPGDPGQHNDSLVTAPGGVAGEDMTAGAHVDNSANMFTAALKYKLTDSLTLYGDWALTANGPDAHYDLGAGGRAVTTDCHDAYSPPNAPYGSDPHCWTGGQLQGTSVGVNWQF